MTTPRGPLDLREYSLDGPGFPTRDLPAPPLPPTEPTVRKGRLVVMIDGVLEELETLTALPPGTGSMPLALITHGTSVDGSPDLNLRIFLPLAEQFARRGYRAVAFARRGVATSTGQPVGRPRAACGSRKARDYVEAANDIANEYAAVLDALVRLPEVDSTRVVGVGQSTGGLGMLALAARAPPGLIGVINFAGGHGGNGHYRVCNARALTRAFEMFGRVARVPALWLYSTADRFFWPSLTRANFDAYVAGGAPARLQMLGSLWYAEDGHELFQLGGRELWQPRISAFLRDIGAPGWRLDPAWAIVAKPSPPTGLEPAAHTAWLRYLGRAGHKAFAVGDNGWGWATGRPDREEAEKAALAFCEEYTKGCRVVRHSGQP
ncbi:MAG: hypothetical protein OXG82_02650 [Gammaproteobacteria bacterium]|nr:hypothetical protein [Gammaproteobacteria bacterium]